MGSQDVERAEDLPESSEASDLQTQLETFVMKRWPAFLVFALLGVFWLLIVFIAKFPDLVKF